MNMYLKLSRVALHNTYLYVLIGTETSVTRLGDLFHLRQLFKACGNNSFAHILGNFCKSVKIFIFLVKSFWATFIDIWRFFSGHTVPTSCLYPLPNAFVKHTGAVKNGHLKRLFLDLNV